VTTFLVNEIDIVIIIIVRFKYGARAGSSSKPARIGPHDLHGLMRSFCGAVNMTSGCTVTTRSASGKHACEELEEVVMLLEMDS
jgi:hypothetical protein